MRIVRAFIIGLMLLACDDIVEVEDISGKSILLVAPANNTVLEQTSLSLFWETLEGAEEYKVQVATPDFQAPLQVVLDSTLTKNSLSVELESGKNYQWRVKGINSGYETGYSIGTFSINE